MYSNNENRLGYIRIMKADIHTMKTDIRTMKTNIFIMKTTMNITFNGPDSLVCFDVAWYYQFKVYTNLGKNIKFYNISHIHINYNILRYIYNYNSLKQEVKSFPKACTFYDSFICIKFVF